jgi:outer membrane lipoprotein LolB
VNFIKAVLLGMFLVGCAAAPVTDTNMSGVDNPNWEFNGRVSLTRGEEGWHASLSWQERQDHYQLQVSGPLGQGAFRLAGDENGVLLVDADGETYSARDADALLSHVTGWALPVTGMRYWVRGLSVPDVVSQVTRDEQGRLARLEQSGWTITYDRYQSDTVAALPAKLQLVRGDISVRLVIDHWQLGLPAADTP